MLMLSLAVSGLGLPGSLADEDDGDFRYRHPVSFFMFYSALPLTEVPKWMEVLSNLNPLTTRGAQVILHGDIPQEVAQKIFLYPLPINGLFLLTFHGSWCPR